MWFPGSQKFSDKLRAMRDNFLKRIVTHLHRTKENEIDKRHIETYQSIFLKKWYK